MFGFRHIAAAIGVFGFASWSLAQPYTLQYGARLTEANGKPVGGPIDVEVSFHRQPTGGTPIPVTLPVFQDVSLDAGQLTVELSLTSADYHAVFDGNQNVWIQLKDVTNGKTYPRQRFSAVPYALKVPVDGVTSTTPTAS